MAAAGLTDVRWRLLRVRHRGDPPRAGRVTSAARPLSPVKAAAPLLARCEERLHAAVSGHAPEVGRPASETLAAGGKRVRPLLVFCSAPRVAPGRGGPRPGRPAVGRRRGGAGAHGDAGPRRPARRRHHAPRAPDGGGVARPRARRQHRRLPVRPRVRRAHPRRVAPRGQRARRRRPRPVAGRDRPAAGGVRPGPLRGGLPGALPAQDRRALLGGVPPGRPDGRRERRRPRSGSRPSARTWGWRSRSSTTSSTWRAAPRSPASAAAPTCATARSRSR